MSDFLSTLQQAGLYDGNGNQPSDQTPFDPTKDYGTPPQMLDNLENQESSGGKHLVNPTTGAMGPYQFTPSTIAMLRDQGVKFDPFDPKESRAAADWYLQKLKTENGGTYQGALKAYGGFDKTDPTQYINHVMNGVPGFGGGTVPGQSNVGQSPSTPASTAPDFYSTLQSYATAPQAAPATQPTPVVQPRPATSTNSTVPSGVLGEIESIGAGLGHGFGSTVLGGQQLLGHGLQAVGANNAGNWLVNNANQGLTRLNQEYAPYAAANPISAGGGNIAGSIGATAPLGMVAPVADTLGGAVGVNAALGGASAALTPVSETSPVDYWNEKKKQIGLGALTGGIAGGAMTGLGRMISPQVSGDVQTLLDKGITPTPGQILGGAYARTEAKLESVPVLGDMIKNAKARAINQFNEAAYNEALAPIGQSFDSGASKIGQEGIAQVKGKIQDVYNSVLPQTQFNADQQFQNEVINLGHMASGLPETQQNTFMKILQNQIFQKMSPNGQMDGKTLKGVAEELGDKASGYLGDGSFDNRQLGAALSSLKNSLMDAVKRSSPPEVAQQLNNADTAWANFARIRSAGASIGAANNEGIFTAAQLQNAVKAGDKSAGKGAFATGNALMQDLSGAGQRVLGSKYPDSGTVGRGLMTLLAPTGLAAGFATQPTATAATLGGIGLNSLLYTRPGQELASRLLTARPQLAQPIGNFVTGLGPKVIAGALPALLSGNK